VLGIAAAAAIASTGAGPVASTSQPQPRLVHAAHEFEAQMMKELLKPMTSGNGLDGEESGSASGSSGALGEFASEALGRALSDAGGFGIASSIVRQLTPSSVKPVTTAVTGQVTTNLHGNTVIKSLE
jgi:Rod binding domain-containing protein